MAAVDRRTFVVEGLDSLVGFGWGFPHLEDPRANEQEVIRIDVACLNEAARLLGTSAWVRVVYESALVVHEVAQVSTGAGEPLTKVLGADLQYLGGNGVADAEDCAGDVAQTLLTIEAQQHAGGAGEHRFRHQQIWGRGGPFRTRQVQARQLGGRCALDRKGSSVSPSPS